jgi:hypothetical protein
MAPTSELLLYHYHTFERELFEQEVAQWDEDLTDLQTCPPMRELLRCLEVLLRGVSAAVTGSGQGGHGGQGGLTGDLARAVLAARECGKPI